MLLLLVEVCTLRNFLTFSMPHFSLFFNSQFSSRRKWRAQDWQQNQKRLTEKPKQEEEEEEGRRRKMLWKKISFFFASSFSILSLAFGCESWREGKLGGVSRKRTKLRAEMKVTHSVFVD